MCNHYKNVLRVESLLNCEGKYFKTKIQNLLGMKFSMKKKISKKKIKNKICYFSMKKQMDEHVQNFARKNQE